jgi:hypothetical protein
VKQATPGGALTLVLKIFSQDSAAAAAAAAAEHSAGHFEHMGQEATCPVREHALHGMCVCV